ncbi:MAG: hypothetical protein IME98_00515 [Proteobacteria bacterium]|nr:hypothetical protein [Pseudomonadota bacterium]
MRASQLKDALWMGVIAGVLWGWTALGVDYITGIFQIESSLAHNLAAFTIGGALLGVVAGGLLSLVGQFLPIKSELLKAVAVSLGLWLLLRLGGTLLSGMDHHRYHQEVSQTIQGFILAGVMGLFLGYLWKKKQKEI